MLKKKNFNFLFHYKTNNEEKSCNTYTVFLFVCLSLKRPPPLSENQEDPCKILQVLILLIQVHLLQLYLHFWLLLCFFFLLFLHLFVVFPSFILLEPLTRLLVRDSLQRQLCVSQSEPSTINLMLTVSAVHSEMSLFLCT